MKKSNIWNYRKFIKSIEFYRLYIDFCLVFCGILKLKGNVSCVNLVVLMIYVGYWVEGVCDGCLV